MVDLFRCQIPIVFLVLALSLQVEAATNPKHLLSRPMRNVICNLVLSGYHLDQSEPVLRAIEEFRSQTFGHARVAEDEKNPFQNLVLSQEAGSADTQQLQIRLRTIRNWVHSATAGEKRSLSGFTMIGEASIEAYFEGLDHLDKGLLEEFYADAEVSRQVLTSRAMRNSVSLISGLTIAAAFPFFTGEQLVPAIVLPSMFLAITDPVAMLKHRIQRDRKNERFRREIEAKFMTRTWSFQSTAYAFPFPSVQLLTLPKHGGISAAYGVAATRESSGAIVNFIHEQSNPYFKGKLVLERLLAFDAKSGIPELIVSLRSTDLREDLRAMPDLAAVPETLMGAK